MSESVKVPAESQKLFSTKPRLKKRIMRKIGENKFKIATALLACTLIFVVTLSALMMQNYSGLSSDVESLNALLLSYTAIPEAYPRVINHNTIDKINGTVLSITGDMKGSWLPYQRIYEFIVSNIDGVDDVEMPYISRIWHFDFLWSQYDTKILTSTVNNYIQTPELTLELRQGDCDDQAVLAFAMMKCYMKSVIHSDYKLYLATMLLADGTEHALVLFPAGSGNLSIIDPAGHYITSSNNTITFQGAKAELHAYDGYWQTQFNTSILSLTLFEVNAFDGSYKFIDHGSIDQVSTRF
jgi:hypothetical protein